MRAFYAIVLLLFLAAIGIFAFQNMDTVTIKYLDRSSEVPLSALVGAVYALGMVSGWTVVGMVKKSLQRVTEERR